MLKNDIRIIKNGILQYKIINCYNWQKNAVLDKRNKKEFGTQEYKKLISKAKKVLENENFGKKDYHKKIINFDFINQIIKISKTYDNSIFIELKNNKNFYEMLSHSEKFHSKKNIIKKLMDVVVPKIIFESLILD